VTSVEDRREGLLELGLELFSARAYDDISIEQIARAAGISRGLLYHYFPSKRDFYVECLKTVNRRFRATTAVDPALTPAERLRIGLSRYLDHVAEHCASFEALMRGGIGSDPEVIELLDANRRDVVEQVLAANGAGGDHGTFRIAVRGWTAFVEEAALSWAKAGAADKESLLDVMVAVLGTVIRRCAPSP
jgi:AcrR family transcriptional regulator